MIQLIAGGKGEGKTKRLIDMANEFVKTAEGNSVFIDDDSRHIYDLHYNIRFIETKDYPIEDYKIFVGFLCGIIAQDRDVERIYIDGVSNVIDRIDMESFEKLIDRLEKFSKLYNIEFLMTYNQKASEFPESVQKYIV